MIPRKFIPMKEKRMRTISLMIHRKEAQKIAESMDLKELQSELKNFYSRENLKSAETVSTELGIPFEDALQFLETVFFESCRARIEILEQNNK